MKKASDYSAVVVCCREDDKGGLFITKLVRDSKAEIRSLEILDGKNYCIELLSWFDIDDMDYYHFGMFLPYYRKTLASIINPCKQRDPTFNVRKTIHQLFTVRNLKIVSQQFRLYRIVTRRTLFTETSNRATFS